MMGTPAALLGVDDAAHVARVCCYCPGGKVLTRAFVGLGFRVSHGACPPCEAHELAALAALSGGKKICSPLKND